MTQTLYAHMNKIKIKKKIKSAYEGQHTIFGLQSLANLTQDDVLKFHPFTCE
jgi:hypothetical protein